ncbi:MAG: hypothetical protein JNK48_10930 [Bryobacterales bacterium]|nr:hypothetical protein [Bryobacterales bacterium]
MLDDNNRLLPSPTDLEAIQIIRTETVLSRLPVHSLSKTGDFDIVITRRNGQGEVELHWSVSHSAKYGPPRQLAYKLDTLVVNRRIDEVGKPVPKVLRLGSLRDIARELNLGGDTNQIRRALRQNAFTGITAKLRYRSATGQERRIEADFTRYGVVFAGEKLPDGSTAASVYLILNEPYLEVLNQAPVRPLNYEYLKELTPAAQRFYEIVSYRVYAALKHNHSCAKLPYSDFCTYSALQRYSDYDHFKKQMYKIHKPHLDAGYLERVMYEDTRDADGNTDWIMIYHPGPKAKQEFDAFHSRAGATAVSAAPSPEHPLLEELTKRGIHAAQARKLLAGIAAGQPVLAQLRWGDILIARSRGRIENPPGFYAYLIKSDMLPPAEAREPQQRTLSEALDPSPEQPNEQAYEEYCRQTAIDWLRERYSADQYRQLLEEKTKALLKQYPAAQFWTEAHLREAAEGMLRGEALKQARVLSFAEFRNN